MNAVHLLEHFDRIAEASDAIQRLRRFILDLAMRGKLVEQNPNDEPASELLKRIHCVPIDIPDQELLPGWTNVTLINLGKWAIGSGFPKGEQGGTSGPYFFVKVSDMNLNGNEKFINIANNYIDDPAVKRMHAKLHPPGTIIFPKIGGAIATNKRRILTRESAIDNNCLGIVFSKELYLDWCFLLLTSLDLSQYQVGTAVPALQQGVLERIPICLPPIAEQRRIVAKMDELMALCDQLAAAQTKRESRRDRLVVASLKRIGQPEIASNDEEFKENVRFYLHHLPILTTKLGHIKELRQTILDLAVQGKLVKQDPNDEPAEELLQRIKYERAHQTNSRRTRGGYSLPPIESDLQKFVLPTGWEWTHLGDIIKLWNGYAFKSSDFKNEGVPVIRIGNLQGGHVTLDNPVYVSDEIAKSVNKEFWIPQGALLIAMSGATTGKVAFNNTDTKLLLNQRVGRIETFLVNVNFVRYFFETIVSHNLNISFGTAIPNLSSQQINETIFPLPPLAEQYRIVAKVNELMALCDEWEATLTASQIDHAKLLEIILLETLGKSEITPDTKQ